jgi:hypothetical protein
MSGLAGLYHSFESNRIPLAVTERSAAAVAAAATERRTASVYLAGMYTVQSYLVWEPMRIFFITRSIEGWSVHHTTYDAAWLAYIMQRTPGLQSTPGLQPTTHSWRNVRDAVGAHLSHTVPLSWLLRRAVAHAVEYARLVNCFGAGRRRIRC